MLKAIVAEHEISGPVHAVETILEKRRAETARKTLGTLVGDLIGSNFISNKIDTPITTMDDSSVPAISIGMRMWLNLSDEDFARKEEELKELVRLRNDLVHHFISQHNIGTLEGCRRGRDALVTANDRIDKHDEELRTWAEDLVRMRRAFAGFLQSDVCHDLFVNGIMPDGTVQWPAAGIVRSLRCAAGELAVDGWTRVNEAGRWIEEREPEQRPTRYGCSSWRQVVHESRVFELRYFGTDGQRSAWYRERGGTGMADEFVFEIELPGVQNRLK